MRGIEFSEKDGKLHFSYYQEEKVPKDEDERDARYVFQSSGIIPKRIVQRGEKAIKNYAEKIVEASIAQRKAEIRKRNKFGHNPDFPISVEHKGKLLKGKIVSAHSGTLIVRLDEPYRGESKITFGFASAMAGHHIFSGPSTFSKCALETAEELLIKIYEREKYNKEHEGIIDLAKKLNE